MVKFVNERDSLNSTILQKSDSVLVYIEHFIKNFQFYERLHWNSRIESRNNIIKDQDDISVGLKHG